MWNNKPTPDIHDKAYSTKKIRSEVRNEKHTSIHSKQTTSEFFLVGYDASWSKPTDYPIQEVNFKKPIRAL